VIVHGLFGSGDNWLTLAGKFPGRKVYLPDLRNHGQSPWMPSFSIPELADDLNDWSQKEGLGRCDWVGHSLGGKAVMELALTSPQAVSSLAVLDMAPGDSLPHYVDFVPALLKLDLTAVTSRSDAQHKLESTITDRPTLQFLLKSLVAQPETSPPWKWRLNLKVLASDYLRIWKGIEPGRSWGGPVYVLYGTASDYVLPADHQKFRDFFPRVEIDALPGAGHWLHAEQPAAVVARLNTWLARA